jgi:hypothetical protein
VLQRGSTVETRCCRDALQHVSTIVYATV